MDEIQDLKNKYIKKEFHNLMLKVFILKKIKAEKKVYPYDLIKKINELPIVNIFTDKKSLKNDIYNTISALSKADYIKSIDVKEGKRIKKYYSITPRGNKALQDIKKNFHELIKNIKKLLG